MNLQENGEQASSPVVHTIYGELTVPPEPEDLIRRFLEVYGEWGYVEVQIVCGLCPSGGTVFDGGAYIGTFSLGMALHGAQKIVAIEPNPASAALVKENLQRNCTVENYVENCALASQAGYAEMVAQQPTNAGATSWRITDHPSSETNVTVKTVAALRERYGPYDLLKLDVEGGELESLRGDCRWIKENKPVILAECNETPEVEQLLAFFNWAELSPHFVAYPAFRRNNFKQSEERIYPIAYEAALLGAKAEQIKTLDVSKFDEELIVRPLATFSDLREMLWRTPRWGRLSWTSLLKPELIALLGRAERGVDFSSFLAKPHK